MKRALFALIALVALALLSGSFYTVHVTEQAIVTQFGKIVGQPITEPGLHFKTPFVQDVNRFDLRVLEWDGRPLRMPTRDKIYLEIDSFARWRIVDPLQFFVALRDERTALSRLDDIIGGTIQGEVAKHDLVELIRTDKARKPAPVEVEQSSVVSTGLRPIQLGRRMIEDEILKAASKRLREDFGIELLDTRFKRLNYGVDVQQKIHTRMASERLQIAERFRSEGQGEAARIDGDRERELKRISSEAYRKVQEIRGRADAEATRISAEAYNKTPEAADFYGFLRTLETYGKIIDSETTMVLSTGSDLYRLLKKLDPVAPAAPAEPKTGP